jgi:hypothetical protein
MLIALSGLKGSGKDTAAEVMIEEYGFTRIAFADALREALVVLNPYIDEVVSSDTEYDSVSYVVPTPLAELVEEYGWDYTKRNFPEARRLLQVMGTEVGRMLFGENVWIDYLVKKYPNISRTNTRYVITDCRFENEAQFVQDAFGKIVWIARPGVESDGHASESNIVETYADHFIENDTTLEDLREDIRFLMHMRGFDPIGSSGDTETKINSVN